MGLLDRSSSIHLYVWKDWNFLCMGQLLCIFSNRAFITINLQESVNGLQMMCVHSNNSNPNDNKSKSDPISNVDDVNAKISQIPFELRSNQKPIRRPGLSIKLF